MILAKSKVLDAGILILPEEWIGHSLMHILLETIDQSLELLISHQLKLCLFILWIYFDRCHSLKRRIKAWMHWRIHSQPTKCTQFIVKCYIFKISRRWYFYVFKRVWPVSTEIYPTLIKHEYLIMFHFWQFIRVQKVRLLRNYLFKMCLSLI